MSDTCTNCGGLIMDRGIAYGWAGKVCHCPVHPSRLYQSPSTRPLTLGPPADFGPCGCVGPKNGQPLCPCQMRSVQVRDGRYVQITDLGPVR
jgi:hypothetical protein